MKTQKSISFIEQPEEMKTLDMDMIRGGAKQKVKIKNKCTGTAHLSSTASHMVS
jgi:hypothetical protein